jgi:hypothetical protein
VAGAQLAIFWLAASVMASIAKPVFASNSWPKIVDGRLVNV